MGAEQLKSDESPRTRRRPRATSTSRERVKEVERSTGKKVQNTLFRRTGIVEMGEGFWDPEEHLKEDDGQLD